MSVPFGALNASNISSSKICILKHREKLLCDFGDVTKVKSTRKLKRSKCLNFQGARVDCELNNNSEHLLSASSKPGIGPAIL